MVGFLIRRIGQAIFVLILVTAATLGLVHLFPGGPVRALLGHAGDARPDRLLQPHLRVRQAVLRAVRQVGRPDAAGQPRLLRQVERLRRHPHRQGPAQDDHSGAARHGRLPALRHPARRLPGGTPQQRRRLRADRRLIPRLLDPDVLPRARARGLVRGGHRTSSRRSRRSPPRSCSILGDPRALVLPVFTYAFLLYALWSRYMRSSVLDNWCRTTCAPRGPRERPSAGWSGATCSATRWSRS